ncbi:MAG TPA: tryptophan 7-halogenase [Blastocatellia bacterium]|nr:tryptophan 7-halogenase [Blastocatellia bacterium]
MAFKEFSDRQGGEAARADVVVAGGGPAGSATAMSLAQSGMRVVIVERAEMPKMRVGETLPPSIRVQLEKLGVLEEFLKADHGPSVGNRSAWGSKETWDNDFIFNPYGIGWHVDRQKFDAMLLDAAVRRGAKLINGMAVAEFRRATDGDWRLKISGASGEFWIGARFVVDATGRASAFARLCGVRRDSIDKLIGIAGYLSSARVNASPRVTLVEAVEEGWWYSALLPDDKLVVVYMTDADLDSSRQARTAECWLALLEQTEHTRARVKGNNYSLEGEPQLVSANSSRLEKVVGDGWLAVGDAAASYDPLSSQGISTALALGIKAAAAIRNFFNNEPAALDNYESAIEKMFDEYIANRARYYSIERRWPDSPFWQRRQALAETASRQIPNR